MKDREDAEVDIETPSRAMVENNGNGSKTPEQPGHRAVTQESIETASLDHDDVMIARQANDSTNNGSSQTAQGRDRTSNIEEHSPAPLSGVMEKDLQNESLPIRPGTIEALDTSIREDEAQRGHADGRLSPAKSVVSIGSSSVRSSSSEEIHQGDEVEAEQGTEPTKSATQASEVRMRTSAEVERREIEKEPEPGFPLVTVSKEDTLDTGKLRNDVNEDTMRPVSIDSSFKLVPESSTSQPPSHAIKTGPESPEDPLNDDARKLVADNLVLPLPEVALVPPTNDTIDLQILMQSHVPNGIVIDRAEGAAETSSSYQEYVESEEGQSTTNRPASSNAQSPTTETVVPDDKEKENSEPPVSTEPVLESTTLKPPSNEARAPLDEKDKLNQSSSKKVEALAPRKVDELSVIGESTTVEQAPQGVSAVEVQLEQLPDDELRNQLHVDEKVTMNEDHHDINQNQQKDHLPERSKESVLDHSVELPSTIPDSMPPAKEQLPTPSTTQKTSFLSQPSTLSLQSLQEEDTLPSPELTQEAPAIPKPLIPGPGADTEPERQQGTQERESLDTAEQLQTGQRHDIIPETQASLEASHQLGVTAPNLKSKQDSRGDSEQIRRPDMPELTTDAKEKGPGSPVPSSPATPAKPKAPLIEKLKAMRRLSESGSRSRLSSGTTPASPWFAPRRSSHTVPDSDAESGVSGLEGKRNVAGQWKPPSQVSTPQKTPSKRLFRSPYDRDDDAASVTSSQYAPPSQPVQGGLRTEYSYFPPLGALSSHFGTETDVLAFVVAAGSISRSGGGRRDHTLSIYITDFSMRQSVFKHQPLVTAQIFRPDKVCLPDVEHGDSILLRSFRVQSFHRNVSLISTETSAWVVFRENTAPQTRGPPVEFGPHERSYARGHWNWWSKHTAAEKDALQAFVPEEKPQRASSPAGPSALPSSSQTATQVNGKLKPKKEGINGVGIELPNSQAKGKSTGKKNRFSTQALAKEWAEGLVRSSEPEESEGGGQQGRRRGLWPRNARGKTKSMSPEKVDWPTRRPGPAGPSRRKQGPSVKAESDSDSEKGMKSDAEEEEEENKVESIGRLRMHELRDGRKYQDRGK